jgi:hypothetical protein
MKTPAGSECRYFFGDYHRGRNREECRLLQAASPPLEWNEKLCFSCPVPAILRANSCEHLRLIPRLTRPFPLFPKEIQIDAYCVKTKQDVKEPQIGCGECHQLPKVFLES